MICIERQSGEAAARKDDLEKELLAMAAENQLTAAIRSVLFHPAFPVDIRHNAKIFREKLAVWAAARVRRK